MVEVLDFLFGIGLKLHFLRLSWEAGDVVGVVNPVALNIHWNGPRNEGL